MRYLLLYAGDETADGLSAPEAVAGEAAEEDCGMPWAQEISNGTLAHLAGGRLQPTTTATSVRNADGSILIADGPFAETKEQILGFDVIECANLDAAIEAASRHPVAQFGGVVEVRPFLGSS
jgi:hypothetical protein